MSDYRAYDRDRDYSPQRDYSPPRRHQSTRTYPRSSRDGDVIEETTYVERGKGPPPRDLIPRRDDSPEEIQRDFPPPAARSIRSYRDDYDDRRSSRRARSAHGRRDDYDDDYDDYASGVGGAAGGYAASRASRRSGGGRRGRYDDDDYYSEDYERYDRRGGSRSRAGSRSPERRKSGVENLLEGLGLGGVAGAAVNKFRSRSQSRGGRARSRRGSDRDDSRSRSRSKGNKKQRQWAQAAQAAIVAGAIEAFRARNEPGGIKGEKGKRILTAAVGAGGIDRLVDRDPDQKSKRHLVEAVVGGLAANRLANGPRDKSGDRGRSQSRSGLGLRERSRSVIDRFRSKSRGRSVSRDGSERGERSKSHGLEKLAAGGAIAAAGKAIYDRVRSKSRGAKDRKRSSSRSASEDSYVPSRSRRRDVGPPSQRSRSLGPNDGAVVGPRGHGAAAGAAAGGAGALAARNGGDGHARSESRDSSKSSSSSDTDLENRSKKMRGKELITAGLATVATIHAAHNVYQGMKGSEKRHQLVAEGKMTVEEARKKRTKAWLQDAAAVGIAALGIKGAYSEWKEMNEHRHQIRELEDRRKARQKRRTERMRDPRFAGPGGYGAPMGRLPPAPMHGYDGPPSQGAYPNEVPPPPIPQNGYR